MKLLTAIQALKQGAIVRDFNHSFTLHRLTRVAGVSVDYKNDNGHTYAVYTYAVPPQVVTPVIVEEVDPLDHPACDIWLPFRQRFTQGQAYRKIADVFDSNGTRYYVLTHDTLGGKLYRKPEQVRLHVVDKLMAA